jgi:hypothetical protein
MVCSIPSINNGHWRYRGILGMIACGLEERYSAQLLILMDFRGAQSKIWQRLYGTGEK